MLFTLKKGYALHINNSLSNSNKSDTSRGVRRFFLTGYNTQAGDKLCSHPAETSCIIAAFALFNMSIGREARIGWE